MQGRCRRIVWAIGQDLVGWRCRSCPLGSVGRVSRGLPFLQPSHRTLHNRHELPIALHKRTAPRMLAPFGKPHIGGLQWVPWSPTAIAALARRALALPRFMPRRARRLGRLIYSTNFRFRTVSVHVQRGISSGRSDPGFLPRARDRSGTGRAAMPASE